MEKNEINILEIGTYEIIGPYNGEITVETIKLKNHTGKERVWKIKSLSEKEIVLEVIKF